MSLPKNVDLDKTNLSPNARDRKQTPIYCALLTGVGRSAVAVICVRGPDAMKQLGKCFLPASKHRFLPGQIRYGRWQPVELSDVTVSESVASEAVVVVPISDQEFEVHAHGGTAAAARIVDDLQRFGVMLIDSQQWMGAADVPLIVQEAQQVLSQCLTARFAAVAMEQVRGGLSAWCENSLASLNGAANVNHLATEAQRILARAELGMRLSRRFHVVLLGHPNVGKSSLVNAIVGYDRSITMDVAGTTRDVLHADTVLGGIPIRLSDTAGIRENADSIEQQGVHRAVMAAEEADLVLLVNDPTTPPMVCATAKKTLHVLNKADLIAADEIQPGAAIETVATTGKGVDTLIDAIAATLVSFPAPGTPIPVTDRQVDLLGRLTEVGTAAEMTALLAELIGQSE